MLENVYAGLHVALVGNHQSVYFFPIYVRVCVCTRLSKPCFVAIPALRWTEKKGCDTFLITNQVAFGYIGLWLLTQHFKKEILFFHIFANVRYISNCVPTTDRTDRTPLVFECIFKSNKIRFRKYKKDFRTFDDFQYCDIHFEIRGLVRSMSKSVCMYTFFLITKFMQGIIIRCYLSNKIR